MLLLAINLKVALTPTRGLVLEVDPEVTLTLVLFLGVLPLPTANGCHYHGLGSPPDQHTGRHAWPPSNGCLSCGPA